MALLLTATGCFSSEEPDPHDCSSLEADVDAFLAAAKQCASDADCENVESVCIGSQTRWAEGCCNIALARGYDVSMLAWLEVRQQACAEERGLDQCNRCCLLLPQVPRCIDSRCQSGR